MLTLLRHRRKSFRAAAAADYRSTVLADSPLFYYRLGESSGSTAYDEVAASSNGTYYNTPTLGQTGGISGDSNTTVLFEQANQEYATTTTLSSVTSLLPCTIECFVKCSGASDGNGGIVFIRGTTPASGLNIIGTTLGKLGYHWRGRSETYLYDPGITLSDNTWYYVALVVESTKATFYVINESGTLTTATNSVTHLAIDPSTDPWYIARDPTSARYFQGYIDEVAIYDQALSQSTLVAHAAAAGYAPTIVPNVITSANSDTTTTTIDCSSITEGHLMIILVCLWATREISSYPDSWKLERTGTEGTSVGQNRSYAFSKIAAATETSYDFTVNGSIPGGRFSYSLLEIPKTGLGVRNATYSTDGTLGSLYSYSTDTLHLAFCGKADSSATEDVIHPSGYTEIVDRTGSQYNHAIAYKTISGASRSLHSGYEFTDPDNTGATGDNNLSTIHLSISDAGPIVSENFEDNGTPVGFTNVIAGSGTISFDETTEVLEGSGSLKVYSDSNTYTYVDLNHEYDHIVAIFGYKTDAMSNRKDVYFLDDELDFTTSHCVQLGSVSNYTKGISYGYSTLLTLTGTVNDFHYVRVEIDRSGGVLKIARSNDKTFPTSGTNYAESTTITYSSNFSGTRYIAFGTRAQTKNSWYDDLEVTGEIKNDNFEFRVATTTASETFTIPCQNVGTFDATIDWGDGSTSTITAYNDADLAHTYATAGDYNISISGTFPNIYFNNGGDKLKVKSVTNLGSVGWTRFISAFYGCSNMTSFTAGDCDTSSVERMDAMFYDCTSLTSLDLSSFNTSSVTVMGNMFFNCSSLTSLDVSSFNTSSVTSMSQMFRNCSSLTSLDLSSFNTSSVTNMSFMFLSCTSLTSLDLSSFNTSNVTNMQQTFASCSSLTSLDLSSFNTSSVTNMLATFSYCSSLTSIDLSSFTTSSVTRMDQLFRNCSSLTSLDVSSFNTSSVTTMDYMFQNMGGGTAQLTITGIEDFDITAVNANKMLSFMSGTGGLSTTVYDELLVNWEAQTGYNAQNPHFGGSKYTSGSAAATARADLVTAGWTITDGGTA